MLLQSGQEIVLLSLTGYYAKSFFRSFAIDAISVFTTPNTPRAAHPKNTKP
jgi:hypothetical protein